MSDQGWISLYRKIQNSFVWTNSDQLKLWLLILMKANHSENKFLFNGNEIFLSSGQMVTGRDAIALEFNNGVKPVQRVSSRQLWRWIKQFEKEQMLSIESTSRNSVITVKNWSEYQQHDQQVSSKRPAPVQQVSTNNNDNNEDKEPPVDYAALISYLNEKSGRAFHNTEANRKLIKARLNDGFTKKDFQKVIAYKSAEWKDNADMSKYLRPNTLFASTHFDDYLNEANTYIASQGKTKTTSDGQRQGKTEEEIVAERKKHAEEITRRAEERLNNEHGD
ncbi:conserved phage C-terminal domain-containing protein [Pediococcus pentosaceus]|uniref:conserved phage C-terminal domain-containing protein n=1 Tax=Pediococcus pentosaceus TaxID=1255 RepID=UPI0018FEE73C|nr:conserved phage C-terminal domain-containing protein [Pediococcus pentosaceus]MBF7122800.1 conserved phage C-terminal domain-containing protein [Pediococcus pentosaceus]